MNSTLYKLALKMPKFVVCQTTNDQKISVDSIPLDTLFMFSNVFTLLQFNIHKHWADTQRNAYTHSSSWPPRTLSSESVGKLFLGPKQRAFLSLMLLLRINIPPLNHSDHEAVCAHDGNFNFLCGPTAVRGLFHFGWFRNTRAETGQALPLDPIHQNLNNNIKCVLAILEWRLFRALNVWIRDWNHWHAALITTITCE